jgi:phytoene synthase
MEILERHQAHPHDIFAGRSSAGLQAALTELRGLARQHLHAAHAHRTALPTPAIPALLPLAPVRPLLDRLERSDPFAPAELAPWRRQWLIWRAARNPVRIAG